MWSREHNSKEGASQRTSKLESSRADLLVRGGPPGPTAQNPNYFPSKAQRARWQGRQILEEHARFLATGAPFCASSSKAQRARWQGRQISEEHEKLLATGAPFCAFASEAQRPLRRGPQCYRNSLIPLAETSPFCAFASEGFCPTLQIPIHNGMRTRTPEPLPGCDSSNISPLKPRTRLRMDSGPRRSNSNSSRE